MFSTASRADMTTIETHILTHYETLSHNGRSLLLKISDDLYVTFFL